MLCPVYVNCDFPLKSIEGNEVSTLDSFTVDSVWVPHILYSFAFPYVQIFNQIQVTTDAIEKQKWNLSPKIDQTFGGSPLLAFYLEVQLQLIGWVVDQAKVVMLGSNGGYVGLKWVSGFHGLAYDNGLLFWISCLRKSNCQILLTIEIMYKIITHKRI